jgi:phosphoenolpyruvate carboxykinase (ATP)
MAAKAGLPMPDLDLSHVNRAFRHLPASAPIEQAVRRGEGVMADSGALAVRTGTYTGRSLGDKFLVRDALTADQPVVQPPHT